MEEMFMINKFNETIDSKFSSFFENPVFWSVVLLLSIGSSVSIPTEKKVTSAPTLTTYEDVVFEADDTTALLQRNLSTGEQLGELVDSPIKVLDDVSYKIEFCETYDRGSLGVCQIIFLDCTECPEYQFTNPEFECWDEGYYANKGGYTLTCNYPIASL